VTSASNTYAAVIFWKESGEAEKITGLAPFHEFMMTIREKMDLKHSSELFAANP
jgi:hypothetical protein